MDMVFKFGKTEPNTKVTGGLTKHVGKASSGTSMETYLWENG